jgi:hypothetical protein
MANFELDFKVQCMRTTKLTQQKKVNLEKLTLS